jgi:hypothetical protein
MAVPNIVIYSNCQSKGIRFILEHSGFEAKYEELVNYAYIRGKMDLPIEILKKADIFIYQPIDVKHGIYSTESTIENSICTYLPSHCKKIAFPYIFNSAMWPFVPDDGNASVNKIDEYATHKKYRDVEPILKLKDAGYSTEEIKEKFMNGEIDFEYQKRYDKCMSILKEKEKKCDVKVSDFIMNNIHNFKMFLTQNHPSTQVYIHCVNQILEMLGSNIYIENGPRYSPNMANLPGDWVQSSYDTRFWKFKYPVTCFDLFWVNHIDKI